MRYPPIPASVFRTWRRLPISHLLFLLFTKCVGLRYRFAVATNRFLPAGRWSTAARALSGRHVVLRLAALRVLRGPQ